jgi:hypothetical protein
MEMRRQRRENWFLSLLVHTLVTLIIFLPSFIALLDRYPGLTNGGEVEIQTW